MKFFIVGLLFVVTDILAIEIYDDCFVTIEDQQEAIAEAKSICLSYGGGGAVFDVLAPSAPVTCKILLKTGEIKVFEKYYAVKYGIK